MKKQRKLQLWKAVFVLLLSFSIVLPSSAGSISDVKKEKKELENQLDKVTEKVDQLTADKDSMKSYVKDLDGELNELTANLNELNEKLEAKELELENTQAELEEAKITEEKQYDSMKKRIKYMYEKGNTAYIEVLLSAQSIGDLINKAEYVTKISEYDRDMLVLYQETKNTIAEKEAQIEQECIEIEALQKEVANEQVGIEALIDEKSAQIVKYEENIKSNQTLIDEYEAEIAEQDAVIRELEAAAAAARKRAEEEAKKKAEEEARKKAEAAANEGDASGAEGNTGTDTGTGTVAPPPSYSGGQFVWPTPSSRRITSEFGYRMHPTLGVNKFHDGIDIGASTGSSIVAAASGTVAGAGYNSTMGNYVMIDHGGGLYTIYMHPSSLLVSSGQTVSAGSTIALVGSTGRSTGPHLHFGVRLNGSYVSPWNYL